MRARPYAQMLTNVLESLVRRTDLYNAETGEIIHPLLVEREEKERPAHRHRGRQGFRRRLQLEHRQGSAEVHHDRAARVRTSTSSPSARRQSASTRSAFLPPTTRRRKRSTTTISPRTTRVSATAPSRSKSPANTSTCCLKAELRSRLRDGASDIIARYERAEIDCRLHRLQRVQVGHPAAHRRRKAAADQEARHAPDHRAAKR